MTEQNNSDDPVTAKVRKEVEKREDLREIGAYRRASDRRDYWLKTIGSVLLGGLTVWITSLSSCLMSIRDTQMRNEILIQQNSSVISGLNGEIKELKLKAGNDAGLERVINAQINTLETRISDQDKRLQMQGQGLIDGNRSIHESLQKIADMSEKVGRLTIKVGELDYQNEYPIDNAPHNVPGKKYRK